MVLFLIFGNKKVNIFYCLIFYSPNTALFEPQAKKNYNNTEERWRKGGET